MSSITGQESSGTQPSNPINPGSVGPGKGDPSVPFKVGDTAERGLDAATTDKTSYGNQNASGTSETRRGEDLSFQQDPGEQGYVKNKTGSESLVDSIERSVHEKGEGEHSREM